MKSTAATLLASVPLLALAAPSPAEQPVLRVGMIPDVNPTKLIRDSRPLVSYLEKRTGAKVELTVPTNYAAVVEALANDQLDFAYLGGFTFVQAHNRSGVVPLVQRDTDQHFHSLFITQTASELKRLQDVKGKTFAFGDVNSTSGHLMPSYFMRKHGIDPKKDLKEVVYTGGHDATALAVANGKVAAGAMDETVYKKLMDKGTLTKDQIRVFYTTPDFFDYVWVARKGLDPKLQQKLANAYLSLSETRAEDKVLLELLRGKKFVKANAKDYDRLEQAARDAGLLK